MKAETRSEASEILEQRLAAEGYHKTAERFAIFETVYSFGKPFSFDELQERMAGQQMMVSRATLYNALNLFETLGLLSRHPLPTGLVYDVYHRDGHHLYQYCSRCGRITEIRDQAVEDAVAALREKRFRREGFYLYIYGICSSCQAKMTRKKKKLKSESK